MLHDSPGLHHVTVGHLFRDLTWTPRPGETWAVVGPVGAGKTTLAQLLLGRRRPDAGRVAWPADDTRLVTFTGDAWPFSPARHYYQQRFNFIEPQDDVTLADFLRAGSAATADDAAGVAARFGIDGLLPQSLITLSNGQARRARLARALLARPTWLILDDPFLGLDVAARADVAELLGGLARQGQRLLLIMRPEALPAWVTHVLALDGRGGAWQGTRGGIGDVFLAPPADAGGSLSEPGSASEPPASAGGAGEKRHASPVIELHRVTVAYGDRPILRDVSWTVRAGERWAVLGPNGSGKSTLLSLLCGDHPQAYANDVRLFGRRRGSGESIWDVKRRVGLVSPELHVYFTAPLAAAAVAATGFFDVLAPRPTTPAQDEIVRALFAEFGLTSVAGRLFGRLSTGEQRLVLLVRALVKSPPLLILDEPFQGLDTATAARARDWLDRRLRQDQALLFVSHHADEVPQTATRRLRLDAGRAHFDAGPG